MKVTTYILAVLYALASNGYAQSSAFTYQGQLRSNSAPANGIYDLKFNVYAVSSGGSALTVPIANPSVPVSNGVFTVLLDFGAGAFSGTDRWLEIGVRPAGDTTPHTTLTPRQLISAVPYAIRAGTATSFSGTVSDSQLSGNIPRLNGGNTFSGPVNFNSPGNHIKVSRPDAGYTDRFIGIGGGDKFYISDYSDPTKGITIDSAGNVGIGTASPEEKLHLHGKILIEQTLGSSAFDRPTQIVIRNDTQKRLGLGLFDNGTGVLQPYEINVGYHPLALNPSGGNVGIGTTSPPQQLSLTGGIGFANNNAIDKKLYSPIDGSLEWMTHDWAPTHEFAVSHQGEKRVSLNTSGPTYFNGGNVGIGTTAPAGKLEVDANVFDGTSLYLRNPGDSWGSPALFNSYRFITTTSGALDGPFRQFNVGAGGVAIGYSNVPAYTSSDALYVNGNVGIGTTVPQAKLHVAGDAKVDGTTRTHVLEITGGSDLAEPFDISGDDIPAGSVVVIDENRPGNLRLSDKDYDTRVAGIVSGAGGVNPGITLSQHGVLEGRQQVALAGRVYAQADATYHAIHPGDLLTTSSTPGHVMRASDRDRAQGAILGKAMTSLKDGTGLVLVLVTLQ